MFSVRQNCYSSHGILVPNKHSQLTAALEFPYSNRLISGNSHNLVTAGSYGTTKNASEMARQRALFFSGFEVPDFSYSIFRHGNQVTPGVVHSNAQDPGSMSRQCPLQR